LFFRDHFATEENEEKRGVREKQKERKAKEKKGGACFLGCCLQLLLGVFLP
jgi:hypothetical protein